MAGAKQTEWGSCFVSCFAKVLNGRRLEERNPQSRGGGGHSSRETLQQTGAHVPPTSSRTSSSHTPKWLAIPNVGFGGSLAWCPTFLVCPLIIAESRDSRQCFSCLSDLRSFNTSSYLLA